MDDDRITLVLAKTSDLRSKIVSTIHQTTSTESHTLQSTNLQDEAENLLNIRDALESLEAQLSSLQALQQQQWYEKEAALAQIQYSQKKLLMELKEYKGKDLEVLREAIIFASETDDDSDLLLPPYPRQPSQSIITNSRYPSTFISDPSVQQNGTIGIRNNFHRSDGDRTQPRSGGPFNLVKILIGTTAKTALTIFGVITLMTMAGFEPSLRKQGHHFKLLDLFQNNEKECPPGRVPVTENGEIRCVVKERVEIPFESSVPTPDVNYGFG